ncbi:MAG: ParB/RepB/Spo0J family partition protein [Bacillota bacterium]|nr:ParB/RepB/Spo0J family partition protein [Bacillota bacterium]
MISSVFSEELPKKIIDIPLNRIEPNPDQPRRFFDLEALSELACSVKEYGVIQPITVKKLPGGKFRIIAGERRYRASCMANQKTIPAIVVDMDEEKSAAVALLENLQRKDLTFFEEAEGYSLLMSEHNMTQEQLSEKFGKSQSAIANKLRLLKLDADLREKIFTEGLTERHARALLKLPDKKSREKALDIIIERKLTVSRAEALIDRMCSKKAETVRFAKFNPIVQDSIKKQRMFCNTINKAINMLSKTGIEPEIKQSENDSFYEYFIRIKK